MDNIHCRPSYQGCDFGNKQTTFGADIRTTMKICIFLVHTNIAFFVVNYICPVQIWRHISNLYIVRVPINTVTVVANWIHTVRMWQIILKINISKTTYHHFFLVKLPTGSKKQINSVQKWRTISKRYIVAVQTSIVICVVNQIYLV